MAQVRAAAVADLLEHLVHRIQGISFARGLKPAQWVALRYLARANESARNVTRFAQLIDLIRPSRDQLKEAATLYRLAFLGMPVHIVN